LFGRLNNVEAKEITGTRPVSKGKKVKRKSDLLSVEVNTVSESCSDTVGSSENYRVKLFAIAKVSVRRIDARINGSLVCHGLKIPFPLVSPRPSIVLL